MNPRVNSNRRHIPLVGPVHTRALGGNHLNDAANTPASPTTLANRLAGELLALRLRVSVYTSLPGSVATIRLDADHRFAVPLWPRACASASDSLRQEWREFRKELKSSTVDTVRVRWTYDSTLVAVESDLVSLLITAHASHPTILRFMANAFRLTCTVMANRVRFSIREVIAVSPYRVNRWQRCLFYSHPISVIPNALPDSTRTVSRACGVGGLILDVAYFSRLKKVRTPIRSFATVVSNYPHTEVRLVGSGLALGDPTAERVSSRRLVMKATFGGPAERSRIDVEYAFPPIFCHPSAEEAQPVALPGGTQRRICRHRRRLLWRFDLSLIDGRAVMFVDVRSVSALADRVSEALDFVVLGYAIDRDVICAIERRHGAETVARRHVVARHDSARLTRPRSVRGMNRRYGRSGGE